MYGSNDTNEQPLVEIEVGDGNVEMCPFTNVIIVDQRRIGDSEVGQSSVAQYVADRRWLANLRVGLE